MDMASGQLHCQAQEKKEVVVLLLAQNLFGRKLNFNKTILVFDFRNKPGFQA